MWVLPLDVLENSPETADDGCSVTGIKRIAEELRPDFG